MGGGGDEIYPVVTPNREENPYTQQLASMASDLWGQTTPIRNSFTSDYFMPFLQGNYNPATMPGFAPLYDIGRTGIEDQYNVAKQNIEASTPRGGSMTNALSGLEYNRAKSAGTLGSQISSNLISDLWNKAYNTGWVTAPSQAMGGMGGAASTEQSSLNNYLGAQMQAQQMMAQQTAAQNASNNQGKASGMGVLGSGIGGALGLAAAPMTGGTSMFGSGMSALGGMGAGKGAAGVTSGLGGYGSLMSQAMGGGLG